MGAWHLFLVSSLWQATLEVIEMDGGHMWFQNSSERSGADVGVEMSKKLEWQDVLPFCFEV